MAKLINVLILCALPLMPMNVYAQQILLDEFWIQCSEQPKFGPKITFLININTVENSWSQKLPDVLTFDICENSNDLIRYKRSFDSDCSGFGGGFFSKWTGKLNGRDKYICEVLSETPKPLYN